MLKKNELLILQLFFHNTTDYLTSKEIGEQIGVSDKTTRKYLKELNEAMPDDLAEIKSVRGYGNQLIIHDDKKFRTFFQTNLTENQTVTEDLSNVNTPQERQDFLLRNLFFESQEIYFDEMLEKLYISETPLLEDIAEIKAILRPFQLFVENNKHSGLYIVGDEQNKRHFIMNYFLIDQYENNLKSFEQIALILENIHIEEILIIVLDEYRNENLTLNDTIILNVAIHIALALMRVEHGHQITSVSDNGDLVNSKEAKVAKNIIRRLESSTGLSLPKEEVYNIALHLKNKQSLEYMLSSQNIEESDLRAQIIEGLSKLGQLSKYPYAQDTILVDGLMTHFIPLILRVKSKSTVQNPFLEEIQKNYPTLFKKIKEAFSQVEIIAENVISEDEWSYIALHVIAARERQLNKEKKNVLVICATGLGSSQVIGERLKNELGSKINIKEIISYYEITEEKLADVDLIISSIDLSNTVFNIPIVNVSVLVSEKDIANINQEISPKTRKKQQARKTTRVYNEDLNIQEIVEEFFDEDLFVYSDEVLTKQEAIAILIDKSVEQDSSIDRAFLENQLLLRESFSSVIFTDQIALPHPIEGVSNKSKVAVLVTPNGVDWEPGFSTVQLTLLLLPDRFGHQQIEVVSKALLPILESPESINQLIKAQNYSAFKENLIKLLG